MKQKLFLTLCMLAVIAVISGCGTEQAPEKVTLAVIYGDPSGQVAPGTTPTAQSTSDGSATTTTSDDPSPAQTQPASTSKALMQATTDSPPPPAPDPAGTQSSPGTACPGTGICKGDSSLQTSTTAIPVQFELMTGNSSVLVMSFNIADMKEKQGKHLGYFQNPSKLYKFGSTYSLATPLFARLKLPPNSRITPTDSCMIQPEKDGKMVVHIKYSHD